ncbi:histidinol-phosphatase HisJ family protein [Faecalimonas sp.]
MQSDFHMHTNFSTDACTIPQDMIEEAICKGLSRICITDHMDQDYSEEGTQFVFPPEKYFSMMKRLREKYSSQIDVRIGVEMGLQPHLKTFINDFVSKYTFDFVIGSVHLIDGKDPHFKIENFRTDREIYQRGFEQILECVEKDMDFDVLGHMDYVVRYGKEKIYFYQEYKEIIDQILYSLISQGKGIELNTAGLKYGLAFAHPHPQILKRYKELGGEIITVGSDAHEPKHIAYQFDRAKELLEECGFKYYTEFKGRKPIFIQVG